MSDIKKEVKVSEETLKNVVDNNDSGALLETLQQMLNDTRDGSVNASKMFRNEGFLCALILLLRCLLQKLNPMKESVPAVRNYSKDDTLALATALMNNSGDGLTVAQKTMFYECKNDINSKRVDLFNQVKTLALQMQEITSNKEVETAPKSEVDDLKLKIDELNTQIRNILLTKGEKTNKTTSSETVVSDDVPLKTPAQEQKKIVSDEVDLGGGDFSESGDKEADDEIPIESDKDVSASSVTDVSDKNINVPPDNQKPSLSKVSQSSESDKPVYEKRQPIEVGVKSNDSMSQTARQPSVKNDAPVSHGTSVERVDYAKLIKQCAESSKLNSGNFDSLVSFFEQVTIAVLAANRGATDNIDWVLVSNEALNAIGYAFSYWHIGNAVAKVIPKSSGMFTPFQRVLGERVGTCFHEEVSDISKYCQDHTMSPCYLIYYFAERIAKGDYDSKKFFGCNDITKENKIDFCVAELEKLGIGKRDDLVKCIRVAEENSGKLPWHGLIQLEEFPKYYSALRFGPHDSIRSLALASGLRIAGEEQENREVIVFDGDITKSPQCEEIIKKCTEEFLIPRKTELEDRIVQLTKFISNVESQIRGLRDEPLTFAEWQTIVPAITQNFKFDHYFLDFVVAIQNVFGAEYDGKTHPLRYALEDYAKEKGGEFIYEIAKKAFKGDLGESEYAELALEYLAKRNSYHEYFCNMKGQSNLINGSLIHSVSRACTDRYSNTNYGPKYCDEFNEHPYLNSRLIENKEECIHQLAIRLDDYCCDAINKDKKTFISEDLLDSDVIGNMIENIEFLGGEATVAQSQLTKYETWQLTAKGIIEKLSHDGVCLNIIVATQNVFHDDNKSHSLKFALDEQIDKIVHQQFYEHVKKRLIYAKPEDVETVIREVAEFIALCEYMCLMNGCTDTARTARISGTMKAIDEVLPKRLIISEYSNSRFPCHSSLSLDRFEEEMIEGYKCACKMNVLDSSMEKMLEPRITLLVQLISVKKMRNKSTVEGSATDEQWKSVAKDLFSHFSSDYGYLDAMIAIQQAFDQVPEGKNHPFCSALNSLVDNHTIENFRDKAKKSFDYACENGISLDDVCDYLVKAISLCECYCTGNERSYDVKSKCVDIIQEELHERLENKGISSKYGGGQIQHHLYLEADPMIDDEIHPEYLSLNFEEYCKNNKERQLKCSEAKKAKATSECLTSVKTHLDKYYENKSTSEENVSLNLFFLSIYNNALLESNGNIKLVDWSAVMDKLKRHIPIENFCLNFGIAINEFFKTLYPGQELGNWGRERNPFGEALISYYYDSVKEQIQKMALENLAYFDGSNVELKYLTDYFCEVVIAYRKILRKSSAFTHGLTETVFQATLSDFCKERNLKCVDLESEIDKYTCKNNPRKQYFKGISSFQGLDSSRPFVIPKFYEYYEIAKGLEPANGFRGKMSACDIALNELFRKFGAELNEKAPQFCKSLYDEIYPENTRHSRSTYPIVAGELVNRLDESQWGNFYLGIQKAFPGKNEFKNAVLTELRRVIASRSYERTLECLRYAEEHNIDRHFLAQYIVESIIADCFKQFKIAEKLGIQIEERDDLMMNAQIAGVKMLLDKVLCYDIGDHIYFENLTKEKAEMVDVSKWPMPYDKYFNDVIKRPDMRGRTRRDCELSRTERTKKVVEQQVKLKFDNAKRVNIVERTNEVKDVFLKLKTIFKKSIQGGADPNSLAETFLAKIGEKCTFWGIGNAVQNAFSEEGPIWNAFKKEIGDKLRDSYYKQTLEDLEYAKSRKIGYGYVAMLHVERIVKGEFDSKERFKCSDLNMEEKILGVQRAFDKFCPELNFKISEHPFLYMQHTGSKNWNGLNLLPKISEYYDQRKTYKDVQDIKGDNNIITSCEVRLNNGSKSIESLSTFFKDVRDAFFCKCCGHISSIEWQSHAERIMEIAGKKYSESEISVALTQTYKNCETDSFEKSVQRALDKRLVLEFFVKPCEIFESTAKCGLYEIEERVSAIVSYIEWTLRKVALEAEHIEKVTGHDDLIKESKIRTFQDVFNRSFPGSQYDFSALYKRNCDRIKQQKMDYLHGFKFNETERAELSQIIRKHKEQMNSIEGTVIEIDETTRKEERTSFEELLEAYEMANFQNSIPKEVPLGSVPMTKTNPQSCGTENVKINQREKAAGKL